MTTGTLDWGPVVAWFGRVPRFHDCEVVSFDLRRDPEISVLCIRAFLMTSAVDDKGFFVLEKHAMVSFGLTGIADLSLSDWNHQNVLHSLEITEAGDCWRLDLESAYGLNGYTIAKAISISVRPIDAADITATLVAARRG
ncbi:MAG: Imm50 family immunity protein [Rhizomicrobium sp.]